jgi:glycosyltransferase involved in cell wall biosynthesis
MNTPRFAAGSARKYLVMLGTAFDTKGGVSSVVNVYRQHGLFERWPILYLATHCDGSAIRKLIRVVRSLMTFVVVLGGGRVEIVHVHASSWVSFWRKSVFILLAYVAHRPVIFHLHGGNFDSFYESMGGLRKRLIRFVIDRASHIIVLSSQWKSWMAGVSCNKQLSCLYNPVAIPLVSSAAREPFCLLFLGRMSRDKGIYDLLEVVAVLSRRYPQLRLFCGGDGEAEQVSAVAQRLGISGVVQVLGWVVGDAKDKFLATAGILVLPSYFEGLPMSVLEAMAAGIPVVTTRVGGIPDAVDDGVDGFMVEPGDRIALETALEKLLADRQLQAKMGDSARQKVLEKFSADVVMPQLERIYGALHVTRKHSRLGTTQRRAGAFHSHDS